MVRSGKNNKSIKDKRGIKIVRNEDNERLPLYGRGGRPTR